MAGRKKTRSERTRRESTRDASATRESGEPGGGAGRRDEVDPTGGVYPLSAKDRPHDLEIRTQGSWGQGKNAPPSEELAAGGSGLVMRDGTLLGGTTAGPSGAPTIDIHHGPRTHDPTHEIGNPAGKHANEVTEDDRERS